MEATREATALWKSPCSAALEAIERFPGQPDPVPDLVAGSPARRREAETR